MLNLLSACARSLVPYWQIHLLCSCLLLYRLDIYNMFHWAIKILILRCYSEMLLLLQMLVIEYLMSLLKLQKVPRYLSGATFSSSFFVVLYHGL
jgi:hypothetical protein